MCSPSAVSIASYDVAAGDSECESALIPSAPREGGIDVGKCAVSNVVKEPVDHTACCEVISNNAVAGNALCNGHAVRRRVIQRCVAGTVVEESVVRRAVAARAIHSDHVGAVHAERLREIADSGVVERDTTRAVVEKSVATAVAVPVVSSSIVAGDAVTPSALAGAGPGQRTIKRVEIERVGL